MHEILLTYDEIKDSRQGSSSYFFAGQKRNTEKKFQKNEWRKNEEGGSPYGKQGYRFDHIVIAGGNKM